MTSLLERRPTLTDAEAAGGQTLALDFGTSTTYLAACPDRGLIPSLLELFDGRPGVETALLTYEGGQVIGTQALEGLATMTESERVGAVLQARFKPEVGQSPEADEAASQFLSLLTARGRALGIEVFHHPRRVILGAPCGASDRYRQALAAAAARAGLKNPLFLEEPLAALVSALGSGEMPMALARQRGLVIDFGGGTCDLAFVQDFEARPGPGDWSLGGRLFDDLFFTLWQEQNPELAARLSDGDEAFLRLYWARVLKERFSQAMALDPTRPWVGSAGQWGGLRDLTWDEFLQRAADYEVSGALARQVPDLPPRLDLIGRFGELLAAVELPPQWVLLVGGSSLWPFVPQAVRRLWPSARVLGSVNPGGAVARGLSLLPALKNQARRVRRRLTKSAADLAADLADGALKETRQVIDDEVAVVMASRLVNTALMPALEEWSVKGGSLVQLKDLMKARCDALEEELQALLARRGDHWRAKAAEHIDAALDEWFHREGLTAFFAQRAETLPFGVGALDGVMTNWSKVMSEKTQLPLDALLRSAVGVLIGWLAVVLTGLTGGAALLLGGAVLLGAWGGGALTKDRLYTSHLPALLTRRLAGTRRRAALARKAKAVLEEQLRKGLAGAWANERIRLEKDLKETLEDELKGLDLLLALQAR